MLKRIIIPAAVVVAALAAVGLSANDSTPVPTPTSSHIAKPITTPIGRTPRVPPAPIIIEAYGDSITAWNGSTPIVGGTWAQDLATGPVEVNYAGGYAHGGYTLAQIEANVHPAFPTTKYVVIMAGINSVGPKTLNPASQWGVSMYDMTEQMRALIAGVGIPADRIIVTSVAPDAALLAPANAWNAQEVALCAQLGCHYIDPYAALRASVNGAYAPSLTMDGIHPNAAGSAILASSIATSVEAISSAANR